MCASLYAYSSLKGLISSNWTTLQSHWSPGMPSATLMFLDFRTERNEEPTSSSRFRAIVHLSFGASTDLFCSSLLGGRDNSHPQVNQGWWPLAMGMPSVLRSVEVCTRHSPTPALAARQLNRLSSDHIFECSLDASIGVGQ